MIAVFIRELIKVIKKDNRWSFSCSLFKSFTDKVNELSVRLILPYNKSLQTSLLDKTLGHKCLADSGFSAKQNSLGNGHTKLLILRRILNDVDDPVKLILNSLITDYSIQFSHDLLPQFF